MTAAGDIAAESKALRATRASLHAVAEHVMAATEYAHKRRLGLRQATGGFATQTFLADGAERRLAVMGTELVRRDQDARGEATERRVRITSLGAAARLPGGTVGMPPDAYRPSPLTDPDAELAIEHFDVATTISQVNYGGSPGDADHDEPYVYVGPYERPPRGGFWNEPFGASQPWGEIAGVDDALRFFREDRAARRQG